MAVRSVKRTSVICGGFAVLLVLFWLGGCKKQSEPAPTAPGAPNRTTTPAPNEPNRGMPMPAGANEPNAQADAGGDLRILYAGHPGSEREADFVQFLRQHFGTVETTNLEGFAKSECEGFDVTLMDWEWNDFEGPRPVRAEMPSGPVVTLGVPGGLICRGWQLKTGYL